MSRDGCVVPRACGLEIRDIDGVVDVAERVGVAVPDLDGMAVTEVTLVRA
jgi:hypothetical protein